MVCCFHTVSHITITLVKVDLVEVYSSTEVTAMDLEMCCLLASYHLNAAYYLRSTSSGHKSSH
jgi:hypothetical protein